MFFHHNPESEFPFITWENDGGAFVLIYLLCVLAVGLPIMMAELLIGRKTQKSRVGALKAAVGPLWGVVGRPWRPSSSRWPFSRWTSADAADRPAAIGVAYAFR